MDNEQRTFNVPAINFGLLQARVEELNKRARKLGCPEAFIRVLREYEVTVRNERGIEVYPYKRKYYKIAVDGAQAVRLSGWRFIATIEPTEAGNIIHAAAHDVSVPQQFRTSDLTCEHCRTNRYRKEVFVVQHEDGRFAQVGRNCLADFVGSQSADVLAAQAEWLASLIGEVEESGFLGGYGGGAEHREDVFGFVAVSAACIRQYGWTPASMRGWGDFPTRDRAWNWVTGFKDTVEAMTKDGFEVTDEDREFAQKAVTWAREIPADVENDYLYNLRTAASADDVNGRNAGIIASIVFAYKREVERQILQATLRERAKISNWIGTKGQRESLSLTVANVSEFDSEYGITRLIKMLDAEGNVVIWRTSSHDLWMEQGFTVELVGRVKDHSEYRGEKQTVITRPTVKSWAKPKEAV
jgi:hypothetical protein